MTSSPMMTAPGQFTQPQSIATEAKTV